MCCSGFFVYLAAVRLNFLKSPTFFIAAPIIVAVCLLEPAHIAAFEHLERKIYDWRVRLAHRYRGPSDNDATNLALIEISDKTMRTSTAGIWTWGMGSSGRVWSMAGP